MCGIAGFFSSRSSSSADELSSTALAMARAIAHRGPDDFGAWTSPAMGLALAHRRLSILDLSPDGHQPMTSASGRFVIVFNGEIYNYLELKAELEAAGRAPAWRGHSDTEVLLAACDAWGVEGALQRSNGMFAIALVDLAQRNLILCRDRMGEKPLYYGWQGETFLFASELKSICVHPQFRRVLEPKSLPAYVRFGYIPAPLSIYSGIRKLLPGSLLRVPLEGAAGAERLETYWRVPLPIVGATTAPASEMIDRLESLLRDAVKLRMHSDVPLGAFLSGGVDSSAIVALMQSQARRPVRTYSIGFQEQMYDEAVHARAVAQVLGTEHTELYVTPADALAVVPDLPKIYDEPFADSSQVPTYLLAKLTRQHVTVALSGDGGDELFGGYVRYIQGGTLLKAYGAVPLALRQAFSHALGAMATPAWDKLVALGPRRVRRMISSDRLSKLAQVTGLPGYRELYGRLVSQWPDPAVVVPSPVAGPTLLDDDSLASSIASPLSWMMHVDQLTYLPDDILVKVDRASMAVALEARVPFLDHRLVEFAAALPLQLKLVNGEGKWLLRQVLYKYVDRRLIERPKQGFGIPIADWLRGPLREWAEELLSESALSSSGVLSPEPIRAAWADHLLGRRNLQYPLWVILMFQAWYRAAMSEG